MDGIPNELAQQILWLLGSKELLRCSATNRIMRHLVYSVLNNREKALAFESDKLNYAWPAPNPIRLLQSVADPTSTGSSNRFFRPTDADPVYCPVIRAGIDNYCAPQNANQTQTRFCIVDQSSFRQRASTLVFNPTIRQTATLGPVVYYHSPAGQLRIRSIRHPFTSIQCAPSLAFAKPLSGFNFSDWFVFRVGVMGMSFALAKIDKEKNQLDLVHPNPLLGIESEFLPGTIKTLVSGFENSVLVFSATRDGIVKLFFFDLVPYTNVKNTTNNSSTALNDNKNSAFGGLKKRNLQFRVPWISFDNVSLGWMNNGSDISIAFPQGSSFVCFLQTYFGFEISAYEKFLWITMENKGMKLLSVHWSLSRVFSLWAQSNHQFFVAYSDFQNKSAKAQFLEESAAIGITVTTDFSDFVVNMSNDFAFLVVCDDGNNDGLSKTLKVFDVLRGQAYTVEQLLFNMDNQSEEADIFGVWTMNEGLNSEGMIERNWEYIVFDMV
ncbi:hypothetical protein HK100_012769 [Physocladia obscura]|uniref:F-box domain-containing protein n=1 Tax=Physocladia obscura TaxID=109957 RepID=A0AAD5TAS7_9FUNG|nr:hypothetical protein HK100_012769 [Physocladia obscura]